MVGATATVVGATARVVGAAPKVVGSGASVVGDGTSVVNADRNVVVGIASGGGWSPSVDHANEGAVCENDRIYEDRGRSRASATAFNPRLLNIDNY